MVKIEVSLSFDGRKISISSTVDSGSNSDLTISETEEELSNICRDLKNALVKQYPTEMHR